MQRKPGGYRKPTQRQRELSKISKPEHAEWFQQFWNMSGASTKNHPAPFPLELAYRLVRMFSFWGDTVLDPFCGTGTTMVAAMKSDRNSVGIDIDPSYCRMAARRLQQENQPLVAPAELRFSKMERAPRTGMVVRESEALYKASRRKPPKKKKKKKTSS